MAEIEPDSPAVRPLSAPFAGLLILWVAAVGFGVFKVWLYASTPGADGLHPDRWPAASALRPSSTQATLVMFVHPRCPCTRASLTELSAIVQRVGPRVAVMVVFLRPAGVAEHWERTDTWATATALPGAMVLVDRDGVEARRFGAETSGQVLVYERSGRLAFAGGITDSRGHEGDNPGRRRAMAAIEGRPPDRESDAVYGCPLADPAAKRGPS